MRNKWSEIGATHGFPVWRTSFARGVKVTKNSAARQLETKMLLFLARCSHKHPACVFQVYVALEEDKKYMRKYSARQTIFTLKKNSHLAAHSEATKRGLSWIFINKELGTKKPIVSVCSAFYTRTDLPLQTCLWMSLSSGRVRTEFRKSKFHSCSSFGACVLENDRRPCDERNDAFLCAQAQKRWKFQIGFCEARAKRRRKTQRVFFCFWIGPLKSHSIRRRSGTNKLALLRPKITLASTEMMRSG